MDSTTENLTPSLTSPKETKGILFDVDGTLYYQKPLRLMILVQLFVSQGYSPQKVLRVMKVIYHYRKAQEALRTAPAPPGENRKVQRALTAEKCHESYEFVSQIADLWFEKKPLPLLCYCRRKGLKRTISYLHRAGFKLGVYSDYPAADKLTALGIRDFFTTIVSSHDPDVTGFKPDTNGFLVAAGKMALSPSEIVYVGDRSEVDGVGAMRSGMHCIIVKGGLENIISGSSFWQEAR